MITTLLLVNFSFNIFKWKEYYYLNNFQHIILKNKTSLIYSYFVMKIFLILMKRI